jgi:uncharacterized RDD family membrane protein YckC
MKSSSRQLFLRCSVVLFLALPLLGRAQDAPPAAEKSTPTPPATPAAPAPAPDAPAPTPDPDSRPAESNGELRRIDKRVDSSGGAEFPIGDHFVPKDVRTMHAVSVFGSTTVEGEVRRDAVSVFGQTTVMPDAKVGGTAVAVLGRVQSDGEVGRDVASVLGGGEINGRVGGKVVSVLGDLTLGPKAEINGGLVVVGGRVTRHPDAIVRGKQVNVPFIGSMGEIEWLTTWIRRCLLLGRPLAFGHHLGWAWGAAFAFLAFYLLLSLLFSRGIERCVETLETRPGSSILASVLTVLLSPVAIIVLAITVVGALLIPFFAAGLFFATLFGKAVMLAWIGRRFTKFAGGGAAGHPVVAVLIGGLIVMMLYTIWGSFLLYKLLSWLGLGVVAYTIALSMKREKRVAAATGPAGGGKHQSMPPVRPVAPVAPMTAPASVYTTGVAAAPSSMSSGFVGTETHASQTSTDPVPPVTVDPLAPGASGVPSEPPPAPLPPVMPAPAASVPPAVPVLISAHTLPRAGFGIRLAAMLVDVVLLGIVLGFSSGLVPRFLRFDPFPGGVLLGLAIYASVMWKLKGTTIGGVIFGLKVVRLDDRAIDWVTAIVRAVSCFLSLCAAGLGFIWVAFDDEKQSWHDKIAGTTVVHVPKGVSLL